MIPGTLFEKKLNLLAPRMFYAKYQTFQPVVHEKIF